MTLATVEEVVDAEVVVSADDAEEFDTRFQAALGAYAEARQELIDCVRFVRETNVAERLEFKSRGDYIADRVSGLSVKWAVEDRRSLVELMAYDENGGMSTRQIGAALGVGMTTVKRDLATGPNGPVERRVESSDGRTRTYGSHSPSSGDLDPGEAERHQERNENRDTDLANGTRNDLTMFAWRYIDFVKAVGRNMPKENVSPAATDHIIQALRSNLADLEAATNVAISKLEGGKK